VRTPVTGGKVATVLAENAEKCLHDRDGSATYRPTMRPYNRVRGYKYKILPEPFLFPPVFFYMPLIEKFIYSPYKI